MQRKIYFHNITSSWPGFHVFFMHIEPHDCTVIMRVQFYYFYQLVYITLLLI